MTRPVADLVKHLWTGAGNGSPITLGSPAPGFFPFPISLDNQIISYAIEHENGAERETGIGTYTHAGTQLTRSFVTQSTAGAPTKQAFTAGTKHVRLTALGLDVVENRAITNPTINDGIAVGYIEGRSRWLNYQTRQLFFCVDHTVGAARWLQVMALPFDAGEFDPTAIDLSGGQLEYDSYTQTGAITAALAGGVTPGPGGSVAVNIIGGGFEFNFDSPFIGLDDLTSGTILESGTSYPFFIRFAPDWVETSPGVFADRVLVGAIGIASQRVAALELAAGDGNTIEEGTDFAAGTTYTVDPADARDRWLKVLGASDGPLTANMIVNLNVAAGSWAGQQGIAWGMVRKADASAFTVTVSGFDTAGTNTRVLRQQGDFVQWRLVNTDLANGSGPGGSKFDDMLITRRASTAEVAAATDTQNLVTPASLATQIAKLNALDTDAGGSFNPAAIDLSVTRAYNDYTQTGNITLALSGATHFPGATATVQVTGNGTSPVTVNGTTVFWADGETGAKTWSDQRTLALWFHPGLGAALAIVPGDAGVGGSSAWGGITGTLSNQSDLQAALNAKQADLAVPSQAEAEGGTATTERVWTAQRIGQAISALAGENSFGAATPFGAGRTSESNRSLVERITERVNVKDWAEGDGIANDQAAINFAIAAANALAATRPTLYFPDGVYPIGGPLTTVARNVSVVMAPGAELLYTGTASGIIWQIGNNAGLNEGVRLEFDLSAVTPNFTTDPTGHIGVKIVNPVSCEIDLRRIKDFPINVQISAESNGSGEYYAFANQVIGNDMLNAWVGLDLVTNGVNGQTCWMNFNTFRNLVLGGNSPTGGVRACVRGRRINGGGQVGWNNFENFHVAMAPDGANAHYGFQIGQSGDDPDLEAIGKWRVTGAYVETVFLGITYSNDWNDFELLQGFSPVERTFIDGTPGGTAPLSRVKSIHARIDDLGDNDLLNIGAGSTFTDPAATRAALGIVDGGGSSFGVSVLDFDVPTDGTTDATNELQDAVDSGAKLLFFPPSLTLNIQGAITLVDDQILWGYGARIIRIGENPSNFMFDGTGITTGVYGFEMDGGRSSNITYNPDGLGTIINLENCSGTLRDLKLTNAMSDAIRVAAYSPGTLDQWLVVDNVETQFCRRSGIAAVGFGTLHISNSTFLDTFGYGGAGIDVEPNDDNVCGRIFISDCFVGSRTTNATLRAACTVQHVDFGGGFEPYDLVVNGLVVDDYWAAGLDLTADRVMYLMDMTAFDIGVRRELRNVILRSNATATGTRAHCRLNGSCDISGLRIENYSAVNATGQTYAVLYGMEVRDSNGCRLEARIKGRFQRGANLSWQTGGNKNLKADLQIDATGATCTVAIRCEDLAGADITGKIIGGTPEDAFWLIGANTGLNIHDFNAGGAANDIEFFGTTNADLTVANYTNDARSSQLRLAGTGTVPASFVQSNINARPDTQKKFKPQPSALAR